MCTEEKRGWGRKDVQWNSIQKGGEMEEWEKIEEAHFFSQYQIKSKASNLVLRAQGKSQAQWSAVAGNKKQWPWAINWDQNAIGPLGLKPHLLPWCGTYWSNSKRRRKLSRKVQKKGKERETHVMLSFPPLFNTELEANKESSFPRWETDLQAPLLQKKTWFFSLPISCRRHHQKNICGNTSNVKWGDGEDKARVEKAEKAAMATEADTTQGQWPP